MIYTRVPHLRNGEINCTFSMKIYTLSCPISKEIRYVGITKNTLQKRFSQHLVERRNNKRKSWFSSLKKQGLLPIMELLDEVDDSMWADEEKFYISYFRYLGFNLVNMTEGGDRIEMTAEIRAKISRGHLGKVISEVTRQKLRLANKEGRCGNRGIKMTESHKEILSKYMKNRVISNETRKKMSESKVKRKIVKFDLNDNVIEEYNSISECAKINNYSKGNIIKVCKHKTRKDGTRCKTAYGYKWEYK